jgi:hypothetical protein
MKERRVWSMVGGRSIDMATLSIYLYYYLLYGHPPPVRFAGTVIYLH